MVFRRGSEDEVRRLLRHWRAELSPTLESSDEDLFVSGFDDDESLKDLASEAPIIRLVNHLFARALDLDASDIHFEPSENTLDVRCRVDGIMTRIERLPVKIHTAVASRLKLMARLDIGEKRLPQDGRIDYKLGAKQLDMRVSTLPGVHGESIVLRILDRSDTAVELVELGMPQDLLASYENVVTQPHGMVLITGPTGSGKTTTLYATLEKISNEKQKIITVEDPVEYQLDGITQIQANASIGLGFAEGLRSIVRQDPDILMIGEIRDHETAEIAIESALTGHLVFSTLHTNDAAGAVTRLQDMGVEGYLISSSLLAIQAAAFGAPRVYRMRRDSSAESRRSARTRYRQRRVRRDKTRQRLRTLWSNRLSWPRRLIRIAVNERRDSASDRERRRCQQYQRHRDKGWHAHLAPRRVRKTARRINHA